MRWLVIICAFVAATLGEVNALAHLRRNRNAEGDALLTNTKPTATVKPSATMIPTMIPTRQPSASPPSPEPSTVPTVLPTSKPIKYPYNMQKALAFSNAKCATDWQWLCAEFVARSLNAGGYFKKGVTNYSNYHGVALTRVSKLVPYLISHGWTALNGGKYGMKCGQPGDLYVFNINGDPYAHIAFATANCKNNQHNPNRCGNNSKWDDHMILRWTGN